MLVPWLCVCDDSVIYFNYTESNSVKFAGLKWRKRVISVVTVIFWDKSEDAVFPIAGKKSSAARSHSGHLWCFWKPRCHWSGMREGAWFYYTLCWTPIELRRQQRRVGRALSTATLRHTDSGQLLLIFWQARSNGDAENDRRRGAWGVRFFF